MSSTTRISPSVGLARVSLTWAQDRDRAYRWDAAGYRQEMAWTRTVRPSPAGRVDGSRMIRWLAAVSISTGWPWGGVYDSHDPCQARGTGPQDAPPCAVQYTATGAWPGRTRKTADPLPGSVV